MYYSDASFSSPPPPPPPTPLLSSATFLSSIFAQMQSNFDCDLRREIGKSNPTATQLDTLPICCRFTKYVGSYQKNPFNRNYVLGVSIMANLYFGVVGGLLVVLRNIKTVDFLATFLKNNLSRKRSILTQRISLSWQNLSRLLTNLCIISCPCFHFMPN